jgi:hypothetical protein
MTKWIKWNGGECPVHPKTKVEYELREGSTFVDTAEDLYFDHRNGYGDLIAYKIIEKYQPTIAETIRDAAINWPVFLGDVECEILYAFDSFIPWSWMSAMRREDEESELQARTFMLFVAEALE